MEKHVDANLILKNFKTKGKQTISQKELEEINVDDIDMRDFIEEDVSVSIDGTNRISGLLKETDKSVSNEDKEMLNIVCMWCEKMLDEEYPSDSEWVAIEACIEVAEKFK